MQDDTVQGVGHINAPNTPYNALSFMMSQAIKGQVCTAIPVRVDAVEPGKRGPVGYLSATPLVAQRDGQGRTLPPASIPRMPYCRVQGGKAAIIIDPEPGDCGIAIFAQQDISNVGLGAAPGQAGSLRSFDMADGMYVGGICNDAPKIWLEMTQEGEITLHAPLKIVLEAPQIVLRGAITTEDMHGKPGTMHVRGNISQDGSHTSTGDQLAGGISQMQHTHRGVMPGSGNSGEPQ